MEREAILWNTTASGGKRGAERISDKRGKKVIERVPARGHQGDYENRRPARGVRFVDMLGSDGHEVSMVLTNGAAHLDPSTQFGQYQRAKARFHGWIPMESCPAAMLLTGDLKPGQLVDESIAKSTPCQHGTFSRTSLCPHYLAERDARRAQNKLDNDERERNYRSESDKLVEASHAQTKDIVEAITKGLGGGKKGSALP